MNDKIKLLMAKYKAKPLPVRPAHMYEEDVRQELQRIWPDMPIQWWESQKRRMELHRQMGLTTSESVQELKPFADAARKPLHDPVSEIRRARESGAEKVRQMREEAGGYLPGDSPNRRR